MATKIVIAGHVDHGKSTLLGRLLSDTDQVFPEKVEKIKNNCEKNQKKFEYAFLLDAFEEEQGQGITIDKTEIPWEYESESLIFIDTPGHREFLKNMVSGASTAKVALIMLDAEEGIREQFKRHSYIVNLLGIKNIIIVINKMDLVNYSQEKFNELSLEVKKIYAQYKLRAQYIIPISAFFGENLLGISEKMSWYKGAFLAEVLLKVARESKKEKKDFRFCLQDTYKFDDKRIYAGKIEGGNLKVGDKIHFLPSGSSSFVKTIEEWNKKELPQIAYENEAVGFTLNDQLFLERGEVAYRENESQPMVTFQMHASLFWFGKDALKKNKNYKLKILTQETECRIESIFNVFNPDDEMMKITEASELKNAEASEVIIKLIKPITCDSFSHNESMGRFVLVDDYQVVGGGIIINPNTIHTQKEKSHLSTNERSQKFGHKGCVLWLTGLPSSGKSTVAKALEEKLFNQNAQVIVLDGDTLRKGLNKDLGFSPEDRRENIRRMAEVASLMAENGMIAIAALISPKKSDREMARSICEERLFTEIFIDCPLEECEKRDPKGLYKKARSGEIKGFTGIDSEYEKPINPEIILDTQHLSIEEATQKVHEYLTQNNILIRNK